MNKKYTFLSVYLVAPVSIIALTLCLAVYRNDKPHFHFLKEYSDVYRRVNFSGYPKMSAYHLPVDINSVYSLAATELQDLGYYNFGESAIRSIGNIPIAKLIIFEGIHNRVGIVSGIDYFERGKPTKASDPNTTVVVVEQTESF